MVVCVNVTPRSAIIWTRSRELSLKLRYQRTHSTMISRFGILGSQTERSVFGIVIAPKPIMREPAALNHLILGLVSSCFA